MPSAHTFCQDEDLLRCMSNVGVSGEQEAANIGKAILLC